MVSDRDPHPGRTWWSADACEWSCSAALAVQAGAKGPLDKRRASRGNPRGDQRQTFAGNGRLECLPDAGKHAGDGVVEESPKEM